MNITRRRILDGGGLTELTLKNINEKWNGVFTPNRDRKLDNAVKYAAENMSKTSLSSVTATSIQWGAKSWNSVKLIGETMDMDWFRGTDFTGFNPGNESASFWEQAPVTFWRSGYILSGADNITIAKSIASWLNDQNWAFDNRTYDYIYDIRAAKSLCKNTTDNTGDDFWIVAVSMTCNRVKPESTVQNISELVRTELSSRLGGVTFVPDDYIDFNNLMNVFQDAVDAAAGQDDPYGAPTVLDWAPNTGWNSVKNIAKAANHQAFSTSKFVSFSGDSTISIAENWFSGTNAIIQNNIWTSGIISARLTKENIASQVVDKLKTIQFAQSNTQYQYNYSIGIYLGLCDNDKNTGGVYIYDVGVAIFGQRKTKDEVIL